MSSNHDVPDAAAPATGTFAVSSGNVNSGRAETVTASAGEFVADYELLEEVGRGGMGVVYRARHRTLGHEVALKMLRGGDQADRDELARFQLEAAAVARLQHAGIVQLREFGVHDGQPFFSQEFLPGGSLAQRL